MNRQSGRPRVKRSCHPKKRAGVVTLTWAAISSPAAARSPPEKPDHHPRAPPPPYPPTNPPCAGVVCPGGNGGGGSGRGEGAGGGGRPRVMVAEGRSGFSSQEETQGWDHSSGQGDASSSPKGLVEEPARELREVNVRMITCEDMRQDN